MRMNQKKYQVFKKELMKYCVGFILVLSAIFIVSIISSNSEREQLFLEGVIKSQPLMNNTTLKRLGDLYIKLNREFEYQIKEMEIGYANKLNKRGEKIYYGVNGKSNIEEMINEDYVNGIESIVWQKNGADRKDGESNFSDMITVLTTAMQTDIDRYDENIDELFTKLFWATHTFTGTSTDLYPCEHGCAYVKYYCGDDLCQGRDDGVILGHFNTDLKYDPFLVNFYEYIDLAIMANEMSGSGIRELFELFEADGTCEVHADGKESFTKTTKSFRGCEVSAIDCYHGREITKTKTEDGETFVVYYCPHGISNDLPTNCTDYNADYPYCSHEESPEEDEGPVGCSGYYCCNGHTHYYCKGHILCCCFGHTNIKLTINIMYYDEMIKNIEELLN